MAGRENNETIEPGICRDAGPRSRTDPIETVPIGISETSDNTTHLKG